MDKIKKVVKSPLFHSALAAGVGFLVMVKGDMMYEGVAYGIAICKFLDAFK